MKEKHKFNQMPSLSTKTYPNQSNSGHLLKKISICFNSVVFVSKASMLLKLLFHLTTKTTLQGSLQSEPLDFP